jgi:hypothetical protein
VTGKGRGVSSMNDNRPAPAAGHDTGADADTSPGLHPGRRLRRAIGYLFGAGLLIASIAVAVRGADWSALAGAEPGLIVLLVVLAGLNLLLSGLIFWLVTVPMGPVPPMGFVSMTALIAASTLLNYLPLRPGLIGRAAYLKRFHNLPYRASIMILLIVIGVSAAVYALALVVMLVPTLRAGWSLWMLIGLVGLATVGHFIMRRVPIVACGIGKACGVCGGWRIMAWLLVRWLDLMVTAARIGAAFAIMGWALDLHEMIILASCGMFITLLGLTPNGLGLREWLYGLIAAGGYFAGDVEAGLGLALSAAVIDRAAEVLIIAPTGAAALAWLGLRRESA